MIIIYYFYFRLDNYSKETTPINQIFGGYIRTEGKFIQFKKLYE